MVLVGLQASVGQLEPRFSGMVTRRVTGRMPSDLTADGAVVETKNSAYLSKTMPLAR